MSGPILPSQPKSSRRLPIYHWQGTGFERSPSSLQASVSVDGKDKDKNSGQSIPQPTSISKSTSNSLLSTSTPTTITTTFEISTDPNLIPADTLNGFFASDEMPWAQPLPTEQLSILINESVCFGIYVVVVAAGEGSISHDTDSGRVGDGRLDSNTAAVTQGKRNLIGFARWITDHVTVVYLTDVYILPEYRGRGLAKWLLACVDQAFQEMDYCRGLILVANRGSKEDKLYRRNLLMDEMSHPAFLMNRNGRGKEAAARQKAEDERRQVDKQTESSRNGNLP